MMDSAAQIMEDHVDMGYGYVRGEKEQGYWVVSNQGARFAHKAAGCLLKPCVGDLVLFCANNAGENFILSVLQQQDPSKSAICMTGDLDLEVKDSRLHIHAGQGISIHSDKEWVLGANEFQVKALKGEIFCKQMFCAGEFFSGQFVKGRVAIGYLESVLDKMVQRVNRCFRTITGLEQVKAGRLKLWAKETLQIKSKSASMRARDKIKIDSEKIHLG